MVLGRKNAEDPRNIPKILDRRVEVELRKDKKRVSLTKLILSLRQKLSRKAPMTFLNLKFANKKGKMRKSQRIKILTVRKRSRIRKVSIF